MEVHGILQLSQIGTGMEPHIQGKKWKDYSAHSEICPKASERDIKKFSHFLQTLQN